MEQGPITGRVGRLDVSYDRDADVLYISIDKPRVADTLDVERGLLVRKDPETHEIVGATVLHYAGIFKKLLDRSWVRELKLPSDLEAYLLKGP